MNNKSFEVFIWGFYTHWLWNVQSIIISWNIPTWEVALYRIFESYWYDEKKYDLWVYNNLSNNELVDKIENLWKEFGINFKNLWKWEILHPDERAHFDYMINVEPTIIEYTLSDNKIIMFKLLEWKNWYKISYKLRSKTTFEVKNNRGELVNVKLYGGRMWFPNKFYYIWFSHTLWRKQDLLDEIQEWWFLDEKTVWNMSDVLEYIEEIIKKHDKEEIIYGDWNVMPFT